MLISMTWCWKLCCRTWSAFSHCESSCWWQTSSTWASKSTTTIMTEPRHHARPAAGRENTDGALFSAQATVKLSKWYYPSDFGAVVRQCRLSHVISQFAKYICLTFIGYIYKFYIMLKLLFFLTPRSKKNRTLWPHSVSWIFVIIR